jgi:hypothetical protein
MFRLQEEAKWVATDTTSGHTRQRSDASLPTRSCPSSTATTRARSLHPLPERRGRLSFSARHDRAESVPELWARRITEWEPRHLRQPAA